MSRTEKVKCDICGKKMVCRSSGIYRSSGIGNIYETIIGFNVDSVNDLCSDCADRLLFVIEKEINVMRCKDKDIKKIKAKK